MSELDIFLIGVMLGFLIGGVSGIAVLRPFCKFPWEKKR